MSDFLLLATVYLATMIVAVPVSTRLGLGSVLGYLIAGIIIGPVLGLSGHEMHDLQHFAEFGVVMMLFIIGLELEPRALWGMRKRLVGLGGVQIVGTMALIFLAALALNQTWQVALALGMILSLSSTAIVLQTLSEKNLMQTRGGRDAFAVLHMSDANRQACELDYEFIDEDADTSFLGAQIKQWAAGLPGFTATRMTDSFAVWANVEQRTELILSTSYSKGVVILSYSRK